MIVGRSARPCANVDEAMAQARESAANQLLPIARQHLSDVRMTWDDRALQSQVMSALQDPRSIKDQFAQEINRPYGSIWRGAVLVDASSPAFKTIVDNFKANLASQGRHSQTTFLSLVGVALAIVLVYGLMDLLTKGYFHQPLRIAAVVLLIAGVIVVAALT